jgi:hypothetical protein
MVVCLPDSSASDQLEYTSSAPLLNPNLDSIFNNLSLLSTTLPSPNASISERNTFSNTLYLTEYALVTLSNESTNDSYLAATCLAAYMFLCLFVRQIPGNAKMYENLLSRLYSLVHQFTDLGKEAYDENYLASLQFLLICFVGAVASRSCISKANDWERNWWITSLSNRCRLWQFTSGREFEDGLNSVIKMNLISKQACVDIWKDM